jgi:hypothetical protein
MRRGIISISKDGGARMKKVALLGDSIRQLGYGKRVPEMLGEEYTVFQPKDNCRFAKYTLRGLFDWRRELEDCDVIHWNNGLWDICELFGDGPFTSEEEYVETMLRVARILKGYTDRVIFATTTPVPHGHEYNKNETIIRYNELIVPKLCEMGFVINDLHALVYSNLDTYLLESDKIHLTDEGIEACAKQVTECILKM